MSGEWEVVTCCTCATEMVLRASLVAMLRRRHEEFYCPHGHRQYFGGQTNLEKAQAVARDRQIRLDAAHAEKQRLEREVADLKRRLARPKNKRKKETP